MTKLFFDTIDTYSFDIFRSELNTAMSKYGHSIDYNNERTIYQCDSVEDIFKIISFLKQRSGFIFDIPFGYVIDVDKDLNNMSLSLENKTMKLEIANGNLTYGNRDNIYKNKSFDIISNPKSAIAVVPSERYDLSHLIIINEGNELKINEREENNKRIMDVNSLPIVIYGIGSWFAKDKKDEERNNHIFVANLLATLYPKMREALLRYNYKEFSDEFKEKIGLSKLDAFVDHGVSVYDENYESLQSIDNLIQRN